LGAILQKLVYVDSGPSGGAYPSAGASSGTPVRRIDYRDYKIYLILYG
tara:strand:- start:13401 stop:13544 length:144 start_codon:yes stop_codon:yes gene_type:complete